ncbi:nitrite reductase [NAD(P)H] [Arthrobacter sp. Hiyo8]|nr:nitrite reductase [NAD(P)H] [Arthrobacter sp. Hiyo8]
MHTRGLEGWHVTVLTEEAHVPYDRVTLSKALTDVDYDLTLGDMSMWEHESISLRTGERVVKINPEAKSVETAAGNTYDYDHLVVATGSDAAQLPSPAASSPMSTAPSTTSGPSTRPSPNSRRSLAGPSGP